MKGLSLPHRAELRLDVDTKGLSLAGQMSSKRLLSVGREGKDNIKAAEQGKKDTFGKNPWGPQWYLWFNKH